MSRGELHVETSRKNSCVITIVGYHGNSVYRGVASIPIWVTVPSLAIWQPVGGSHGRLPQVLWNVPPGVKRPGHEANHSSLAEFKNPLILLYSGYFGLFLRE
jgi:hypothetical protein